MKARYSLFRSISHHTLLLTLPKLMSRYSLSYVSVESSSNRVYDLMRFRDNFMLSNKSLKHESVRWVTWVSLIYLHSNIWPKNHKADMIQHYIFIPKSLKCKTLGAYRANNAHLLATPWSVVAATRASCTGILSLGQG